LVDRIVASVDARSLYRLPASDTAGPGRAGPPALHYVLGQEIAIVMREGEVERMEVVGQTRGVHLEPLRPPAARADSTAVRDTAAVEGAPTPGRGPPADAGGDRSDGGVSESEAAPIAGPDRKAERTPPGDPALAAGTVLRASPWARSGGGARPAPLPPLPARPGAVRYAAPAAAQPRSGGRP
jgi:hypothetical protein